MGKKMGINTKALEARERKDAQKKAKNEANEKKKEEEFWRDDDKHVSRKLDRQRERELKAQEERERKAANKAAYEQDMEIAEKSAKSKVALKQAAVESTKVSRHEITKNLEEEERAAQLGKQLRKVNLAPTPLVPNVNRLDDGENASSIDQALDLLKTTHSVATESKSGQSAKKR